MASLPNPPIVHDSKESMSTNSYDFFGPKPSEHCSSLIELSRRPSIKNGMPIGTGRVLDVSASHIFAISLCLCRFFCAWHTATHQMLYHIDPYCASQIAQRVLLPTCSSSRPMSLLQQVGIEYLIALVSNQQQNLVPSRCCRDLRPVIAANLPASARLTGSHLTVEVLLFFAAAGACCILIMLGTCTLGGLKGMKSL